MLYLKTKLIVWADNIVFVPSPLKLFLVTAARCSDSGAHVIKMNCLLRTKHVFIDGNV